MSVARRSVRLQAPSHDTRPTRLDDPPNHEQDNSEDDRSSNRTKPSRKKRRVLMVNRVSTVKRKRAGKLSSLPDMPIDILYEIFGHLLPLDLLRLARATKSFRRTLMNRSSISVWKQARANVSDLPDCPSELSEPEYANLAFDTHCYFCAAQGAGHVLWGFFKRVCKSCLEIEYTAYHWLGLDDFCDELGIASDKALTDVECLLPINHGIFRKAELDTVLLEYAAIESAVEQVQWKITKTSEKLKRMEFCILADKWHWKWKEQRQHEIQDLKDRRSAAILDRMKGEGWADVVENLDRLDKLDFERHKLVKQNKDLTDRIWKNIKPQIIPLFQTFRAKQRDRRVVKILERRIKLFSQTFKNHCASLPFDTLVAPIDSIVPMGVVHDIMHSEDWDTIPDESLFQNAFSQVVELSESWKADLTRHLYQLVATPEDNLDSLNPSLLYLATSLFRCRACKECHLTYQQVLSHRCRSWSLSIPSTHRMEPVLAMHLRIGTEFVMLKDDILLCPHRGRMKTLLDLCNLSEEATMATVQEMNPLVECTDQTCLDDAIPVDWHAMYWYELLSHEEFQPDTGLRLLDYTDLARLMFPPLPGVLRTKREGAEHGKYGCKYCYTPYPLEFPELQNHLTERHDITIDSRLSMEHYHIHPGAATNKITYGVLYGRLIQPSISLT